MLFGSRNFRISLLAFVLINLALYIFIYIFGPTVEFARHNYFYNSHHYLEDLRAVDGSAFNFLRSLGQYDAQWYLKIAQEGYPKNPKVISIFNKQVMDGL